MGIDSFSDGPYLVFASYIFALNAGSKGILMTVT